MKINLDSDVLKEFFIQHGEKIVLGVVLLGVTFAIYRSVTKEGFDESLTPDKMQQVAVRGEENIRSTKWDEVVQAEPERVPRGEFAERVKEAQKPAQATPYAVQVPWNKPLGRPGAKRTDPETLKPEALEVAAAVGPLAVTAKRRYLLAKLEDATDESLGKKKKKKSRRKKKDEESSDDLYGGGEDPSGSGDQGGFMSGLGNSGPSSSGGKRKVPASLVCGYRPGAVGGGMGASSGEDGAGGQLGGPAGAGAGAGLSPGTGTGLGGAGNGGQSSGGAAAPIDDVIGQPVGVIAVKALFPFKKQQELYKQAFGEAVGYDPVRDRVDILFAYLQRADVTDDPDKELKDEDFKDVPGSHTLQYESLRKKQKWAGLPEELVDPAFVDKEATLPCPPLMLRCLEPLMLHSKSPKRGSQSVKKDESTGEEESQEDETPSDVPGADSDVPGPMGGYPGSAGDMAGGAGGMAGEGPGGMMGGMPGGMGGLGGMGGMPGGMGGGGMMGGYGATSPGVADIEYKLVRLYDFTAKPGRKYRYRVRVLLRDPNNPNPSGKTIFKKPSRRYLAKEVIERLAKQEEEAKKAGKGVPFWVDSGWSDPSPVVQLPDPRRVAVGPITRIRPGKASVQGLPVTWERGSPEGQAVPIVWNSRYATDISVSKPVQRGTVLNARVEAAEVLEPVSLVIKLLKNAVVESDYVVVDLAGGTELPSANRKERLAAPAEYLLMSPDGSLQVRSELTDAKDFAFYRFDFPAETLMDAGGYGGSGPAGGPAGAGGGGPAGAGGGLGGGLGGPAGPG